jgi:hypothetical protein
MKLTRIEITKLLYKSTFAQIFGLQKISVLGPLLGQAAKPAVSPCAGYGCFPALDHRLATSGPEQIEQPTAAENL